MEADPSAAGAPRRLRPETAVLLAASFLSGLLSLVYQIVWSRLFYPVFGMNLGALTAVVTAFMGGLGLGARLFGRLVDRVDPLKVFACLEAGIGLFGLLIPHLMGPGAMLFARLTPLGTPEPVVQLVRFAGVTLLLAGPCLLMGGTFPAMVRALSRSPSRLGRDLGALYALNTAGAACGALLAGLWLLPHMGMDWISTCAALGNFLLVLGLWRAGPIPVRDGDAGDAAPRVAADKAAVRQPAEMPAPASGERAPRAAAPALLGLLFITGYLGLSYELLWTRALTQALGATYFSFSIILAAMLLGIVLGSALYRAFLADREARGLLAVLTILLFLASALSFLIVERLHPFLVQMRAVLGLTPAGHAWFVIPPLALSLVAFLPTAVLFGAIFPLCLRHYAAGSARPGGDLGLAYGINTAGAVAGVVLTGVVTIDRLGSGGTLRLLFLLATAAVWLAFRAAPLRADAAPGPSRLILAGVVTLALVATALFPTDIFFANQLHCLSELLPNEIRILFRAEDATSMATLVETPRAPFKYVEDAQLREGTQRNIWHSNWRGVGGTRIYLWNVVGGYLAGMIHPDPRDVLVIGYGSGRQLRTLVGLPYLQHVDVVEINRINFAASDYFYLDSRSILADPRVTVRVDDGRNHLLRSRRLYDVIMVDVGGLGSDGAEFFYTREFLDLCRQHLKPGGLVFTWMDVRHVVEPLGLMYQATLRDVFPGASVWLGSGEPTCYGWLWLVGSDRPLSLDAARLRQRWESLTPSQIAELALAGVREPAQLAALELTDLGGAAADTAAAGGAGTGSAVPRLLTDDRPYSGPIWEIQRPPGSSFATPDAYSAALLRLLQSGQGPRLAGATDEERTALEKHRQAFGAMIGNGILKGPFKLPAASASRTAVP
jgi:spermidine synthase